MIKRKTGEVLAGDFRNDHFEGKQRFEKQLSQEDVERYFKQASKDVQRYIFVT